MPSSQNNLLVFKRLAARPNDAEVSAPPQWLIIRVTSESTGLRATFL
jgi:hypothetical protein